MSEVVDLTTSITQDPTSTPESPDPVNVAPPGDTNPKRSKSRPGVRRFLRWSGNVAKGLDHSSHGYVPFTLWLMLLFGGIWFPATPYLQHLFNGAPVPQVVLTGGATQGNLTVLGALAILPCCLLFWTWTNLAFLCVMASAMGEVNRWNNKKRDRPIDWTADRPDYRMACTRAFFVYLFILLNELAVVGTLTPAGSDKHTFVQEGYTRIAVLASLLCFVASYRPSFYEGLVSRFGESHDRDIDPQSPVPGSSIKSVSQKG